MWSAPELATRLNFIVLQDWRYFNHLLFPTFTPNVWFHIDPGLTVISTGWFCVYFPSDKGNKIFAGGLIVQVRLAGAAAPFRTEQFY